MLSFISMITGPRAKLAKRLQYLLDHDVSDNTDKTRAGGSTYLARVGVQLDVIKERGDWKSDQVLKYLRRPVSDRVALDEKVARLLSHVICD